MISIKEPAYISALNQTIVENYERKERGMKHNNKICVGLSRFAKIYSLCLSKSVDAFPRLYLSLFATTMKELKQISFRIKQTNRQCFVFVPLYHDEVTTGSDWNVKGSTTPIVCLGPWCNIN